MRKDEKQAKQYGKPELQVTFFKDEIVRTSGDGTALGKTYADDNSWGYKDDFEN